MTFQNQKSTILCDKFICYNCFYSWSCSQNVYTEGGLQVPSVPESLFYLKLPEDAPSVSVVVMSKWDVLHAGSVLLQVFLHVLKEPGLVVVTNAIDLANI